MKTTAQLINSLPWPDEKYQYAVVNTRPDSSFLIVYSEVEPSFHSVFRFWVNNRGDRATSINGEETTDWKSAIVTREQWLKSSKPAEQQTVNLPTAREIILSVPRWPEGKNYAVLSRVSTGVYGVCFCIHKPVFASTDTTGANQDRWMYQDPPYYYGSTRKGDGWQDTIVTYKEWLAGQPPAQPLPQVGETWMTSNGPVEIVYVKKVRQNDPNHWRCCAEHKLGALNIYGLEELKPMPPEVMFTNAALSKLEEEPVDMQALLVDVAQLISAGQLDAELAALGYVPAKADV